MRKSKWLKRLFWVVSSIVFFLIIGYFAMNTAASYVLKSIVPQVPIAVSDLTDPAESIQETDDITSTTEIAANASEAPTKPPELNEQREAKEAEVSPTQVQNEVPEPLQAASTQSPAPKAAKDALEYQANVTTEKVQKVEESISLKEKAAVTSVLMKKLSASDLQLLAQLAGSGFSVEEKKKAKAIILNKLSESEYNQLIQIAVKYGLSEGKNYKDSKK